MPTGQSVSSHIHAKAERLLAEGRVIPVGTLPDGGMLFRVKGDTGRRRVTVEADRLNATCDCPSRIRCSHMEAVLRSIRLERGRRMTVEAGKDDEPIEAGKAGVAADIDREGEPEVGLIPVEDRAYVDVAQIPISWKTLEILSRTEFVPSEFRNRPSAVLGAVLWGREHGLGPMESLRSIDVIEGTPSPSSELMLRLYRRAGHRLEVLKCSDEMCEVEGTRSDNGDSLRVSFTHADAERAELTLKPNWSRYPADMLYWRATARLIRRLAPDCLDQVAYQERNHS